MGAFLLAVAGGLIAGISAAVPWLIYARNVVPGLERERARPAAYVVAAVPALLASAATAARLFGLTTGSLRTDVILIVAVIGLASSWGPIVRGVLTLTGGPGSPADPAVPTAMRSVAAGLAAILFLSTATWVVAPAYASLQACMDAEEILADVEPQPPNPMPLPDAIPHPPPEPGALYAFSFPQNLEQAATSRHDENTRAQLVEAGFVAGHFRSWYAADGRWIQIDAFEFGTEEGAARYQAAVTRHACQFANEAFTAPMDGIGLQVRYGSGDPIVEQISWLAGNRRYLVSHSALDVPSDHGRILAIQQAALATGQ